MVCLIVKCYKYFLGVVVVNVREAAKILNVSQQFIRIGLQQQRLPIGTAVKMSSRWTYHISEKMLYEYIEKGE